MALGADFHRDFLPIRLGPNLAAAGAFDDRIDVLGMNVLFHVFLHKKRSAVGIQQKQCLLYHRSSLIADS
jgi:hypothetical protein